MKLSNMKAPKGANKDRKRVGRGRGSGLGKTAGRGGKGQKARVGNMNFSGFEGGQMPLQRRLPKIGFWHKGKEYDLVNLDTLEARFEDGAVVDVPTLTSMRLARKAKDGVKVLGRGEITKKLTVRVHKVSEAAREKIEKAGGTVELVELAPKKSTEAEGAAE